MACVDHARFLRPRRSVSARCHSGFAHPQPPLFTHSLPRRPTIICRHRNEPNSLETEIGSFVDEHRHEVRLWGETAVPYLLLLAFYLEGRIGVLGGEALLGTILSGLVHQNRPQKEGDPDVSLSDPYLEIDDAIAWSIGIRREAEWDRPSNADQAYSLRALVMLLARRLRRQLLAINWYGITDVHFIEMFPAAAWALLVREL